MPTFFQITTQWKILPMILKQTTKFQQKLRRRIGHFGCNITAKTEPKNLSKLQKVQIAGNLFPRIQIRNQAAIGFGHVDGLERLKGNCTWRKFVNKYLIYTCKLYDLSTSALGTTTWDLLK